MFTSRQGRLLEARHKKGGTAETQAPKETHPSNPSGWNSTPKAVLAPLSGSLTGLLLGSASVTRTPSSRVKMQ